MIVSGGQQRDLAMHIYVSNFPEATLQSRLPHNIEQNPQCYTVDGTLCSGELGTLDSHTVSYMHG